MSEEHESSFEEEGIEGKKEEEVFQPVEPVPESPVTPEDVPPPVQTTTVVHPDATFDPTQPQEFTEEELLRKKKRKRRNWWLIGCFGIATPILSVIGAMIFIMMALIGAFETCAVACCGSCSDTCVQACDETCCVPCSEQCSDACTCDTSGCCDTSDCCDTSECCSTSDCCSSTITIRITLAERLANFKNQLKWILHTLFGFFK
ncbi:MAG: hypothetical protein ACTSSH_01885 [Candidatus Heimdallarchaeota archaeon]